MRATAVDMCNIEIGKPNVTNEGDYSLGANTVTYDTYSHWNIILLLCYCASLL